MVDGRGGVRPQWRSILGVLAAFDPAQLADRAHRLERAAAEDGPSAWHCDPVPLPIAADEFAVLEAGLRQRACLLEAILADIYGPQTLLSSGALPAALVHANPAFLRACRTTPSTPQRFLQAYAADLVRSPDGQWRVLADRTGGALGIGYARESRRLLARVLPELFRPTQVRQLRPFFEAWQDALLRAAASGAATSDDGRMPFAALLTPGVDDPHWPEHLALSRDLGCALVQARDLTVRSGLVFLKTLRGLQQVDVLLRRVPGGTLDGLELASSPGAGITGLLDAARSGAVQILNHPGAAAIEAPAFAAFLPALCRKLLGRTLALATIPTLWMADEGAQRTITQDLKRWNVRSALNPAAPAIALAGLTPGARLKLEQAIAARAWQFIASNPVLPSLAPCKGPDGLTPRPVVLRLFLMHDGTDWRMMQGGLARVLSPGEHVTEALPPGALFKDVWVLRQDNQDIHGREPAHQPAMAIHRSIGDVPSRVADDFFWLGRYVERLETQARLGRAGLLRRTRGAPLPREIAEIKVVTACLAGAGLAPGEARGDLDDAMRDAMRSDGMLGQGLLMQELDCVAGLVEALRDRLTIETHAAFAHALRAARQDSADAARSGLDGLVHAMAGLQRLATTVAGVAAEGMVRGGGWLFLDLGRRIERAQQTAAMLATVLDQRPDRIESALSMALELCDSAITYRGRYMSALQPAPVLDLVVSDISNPRALAYQFTQAARLLEQADPSENDLARSASDLLQRSDALVDRVMQAANPAAAAVALPPLLRSIAFDTTVLSDRVTRRFFAVLPALQSIGLEVA